MGLNYVCCHIMIINIVEFGDHGANNVLGDHGANNLLGDHGANNLLGMVICRECEVDSMFQWWVW